MWPQNTRVGGSTPERVGRTLRRPFPDLAGVAADPPRYQHGWSRSMPHTPPR
jgi:hypothetical protein